MSYREKQQKNSSDSIKHRCFHFCLPEIAAAGTTIMPRRFKLYHYQNSHLPGYLFSSLADHFFRVLVLAQAQKDCLTHLFIVRRLGESYFTDKLWLHPLNPEFSEDFRSVIYR